MNRILILAFLAGATAFAPAHAPSMARVATKKSALVMSAEKPNTQAPLARLQSAAIAATTLSYSLPALAQSEGTGRPLGIDDIRLPIVLATGFFLVRQVYCSWAEEQDNDDFFDGYQRNDNVIGYD